MKKLNVVVADSSSLLLQECAAFFNGEKEIAIIGLVDTAQKAFNLLLTNEVDVLIIDLKLLKDARFNFIDKAKTIQHPPLLIPTFSIIDDNGVDYCAEAGLGFMTKPFSFTELKERLLKTFGITAYPIKANKNIDEKLSNIFIRAGIPPHIKGYQFLREAVKLSVYSPEMINNVTKQLYPTVATRFETSASKVERAIRHAIDVAWSRGKIENINAIFGIKIYGKGEKPTNGELIALLADKLIIEGML